MTIKRKTSGFVTGGRFRKYNPPAVAMLRTLGITDATAYNYLPNGHQNPKKVRPVLWKRTDGELIDILHRAKQCYQNTMQELRPDLGLNHEQCVRINNLWCAIKTIFKRRGYEL